MKTYVLVVAAGLDVSSVTVASLFGKRYRNVPAMREAVEQKLGAFDENGWCFYPATYFCEKWNATNPLSDDEPLGEAIPTPNDSYIAILEVENDE